MKKLVIFLLALAVAAMFACKKTENENTSTTASSSDTAVSATDTSSTTTTNPDTSTTTGTATAQSGANLTDDEKQFMTKAAQGGLAEVSLGTTASQKATNPDVKSFGQKMVDDHGKANDQLKQLATTKGVTLPTDTDDEHKKIADKLNAEPAPKFDKAYMDAMVKDHDKDVKEFEEASKKIKDPDLKSWTDATLGVIKQHQQMAHDIDKKLK